MNAIYFGTLQTADWRQMNGSSNSQKVEIFSIGDTKDLENQAILIRWVVHNGKLIQQSPVCQVPWLSVVGSNFTSDILVTVDGFKFRVHIPCIQEDIDDCQEIGFRDWDFWCHDKERLHVPFYVGEKTNWVPKRHPFVNKKDVWLRLIMNPVMPGNLNSFIGKEVRLFLPTGVIPVVLEDISDYDLVCQRTEEAEGNWGVTSGRHVIFDLAIVLNIAAPKED